MLRYAAQRRSHEKNEKSGFNNYMDGPVLPIDDLPFDRSGKEL